MSIEERSNKRLSARQVFEKEWCLPPSLPDKGKIDAVVKREVYERDGWIFLRREYKDGFMAEQITADMRRRGGQVEIIKPFDGCFGGQTVYVKEDYNPVGPEEGKLPRSGYIMLYKKPMITEGKDSDWPVGLQTYDDNVKKGNFYGVINLQGRRLGKLRAVNPDGVEIDEKDFTVKLKGMGCVTFPNQLDLGETLNLLKL